MALTQVKSDGIATGAVTATQIAVNAVTVDDIADGSISTAKLADDSVNGDKLANTAVTAGTYGSSSAIPSITVDAQGRITSASTSSIDSTTLTNGTSNFSVSLNGNITAIRSGTERMVISPAGINVTGSVTCDGIQCDGVANLDGSYVSFNDNGYIRGDVSGVLQYQAGSSNTHRFVNNGNSTTLAEITNGGLHPGANNTYDLGTSSLRWRNVYTNDLNLSNEGGTNDVDGTWGSWTIQEGEDDLFLLNRRNGKKYKFALTEVN